MQALCQQLQRVGEVVGVLGASGDLGVVGVVLDRGAKGGHVDAQLVGLAGAGA